MTVFYIGENIRSDPEHKWQGWELEAGNVRSGFHPAKILNKMED